MPETRPKKTRRKPVVRMTLDVDLAHMNLREALGVDKVAAICRRHGIAFPQRSEWQHMVSKP